MTDVAIFVLVVAIYLLIGTLLTKYVLREIFEFVAGQTIVKNGEPMHFKRELDDTEITIIVIVWPLMLIVIIFGAILTFGAMAITSVSGIAPMKKLCGFVRRKHGK